MTTYSSVLAWRIPWTEQPDWPQSRGSQRVGHGLKQLRTQASAGDVRDTGLIPGLGSSPGRRHVSPSSILA